MFLSTHSLRGKQGWVTTYPDSGVTVINTEWEYFTSTISTGCYSDYVWFPVSWVGEPIPDIDEQIFYHPDRQEYFPNMLSQLPEARRLTSVTRHIGKYTLKGARI
jgi:hypothetical protein